LVFRVALHRDPHRERSLALRSSRAIAGESRESCSASSSWLCAGLSSTSACDPSLRRLPLQLSAKARKPILACSFGRDIVTKQIILVALFCQDEKKHKQRRKCVRRSLSIESGMLVSRELLLLDLARAEKKSKLVLVSAIQKSLRKFINTANAVTSVTLHELLIL